MANWAYEEDKVRQMEESIPSRRLGEPQDIADGIVYLAGGGAEYINGETVVIDGGAVRT